MQLKKFTDIISSTDIQDWHTETFPTTSQKFSNSTVSSSKRTWVSEIRFLIAKPQFVMLAYDIDINENITLRDSDGPLREVMFFLNGQLIYRSKFLLVDDLRKVRFPKTVFTSSISREEATFLEVHFTPTQDLPSGHQYVSYDSENVEDIPWE